MPQVSQILATRVMQQNRLQAFLFTTVYFYWLEETFFGECVLQQLAFQFWRRLWFDYGDSKFPGIDGGKIKLVN